MDDNDTLDKEFQDIYDDLYDNQTPLDPEMAAILIDNLCELYSR